MKNLGGTYRARTPAETLNVIKPYIRTAGITRLARITGLDTIGLPVYTCVRPNAKSLSTSQGKGLTDDLAMCSAYMEAIEVYYAEELKPEIQSTIENLDDDFICPTQLTPSKLCIKDPKKITWRWVSAKNLITNTNCLIPYEAISFDLTEDRLSHSIIKTTTTGLASGNTLDEALCHSLYEIIERSCLAVFKKKKNKEKYAISPETIHYEQANAILDILKNNHINVAIFDITNAFDVPTYHCIIADDNPLRKLGHFSGSGTHHSSGMALCRALTEAVQSRLTYISGSRDDMYPKCYNLKWSPLKITGKKDFHAYNLAPLKEISEQKSNLLNTFSTRGFKKVITKIHTSANEPISVVQTIVPGLLI